MGARCKRTGRKFIWLAPYLHYTDTLGFNALLIGQPIAASGLAV